MAKTILQRWHENFTTSDDPTSNRDKTSAKNGAFFVSNSLSDDASGMNNWNAQIPVPSGRFTTKIGMLWNSYFTDRQTDEDKKMGIADAVAAMADQFGPDGQLRGQADFTIRFDGRTYASESEATNKIKQAVRKNNIVRAITPTDAINAFKVGFTTRDGDQVDKGYDAFFAAVDEIGLQRKTVKSNYRLGLADPEGAFGNFTKFALQDKNSNGNDLGTRQLNTLAAQQ